MKTMQIIGWEFDNREEAIWEAKETGRSAITIEGKHIATTTTTVNRLDAAGVSFALLGTVLNNAGATVIVTTPIN